MVFNQSLKSQDEEIMNSPQYDKALLKSVGDDVFISSAVEIRRPHLVSIGNHVAIDSGFYLTTALETNDHIHIGPYVSIIGGREGKLTLGRFTNIAAKSTIICASDAYLGEGLITAPGVPEEMRDRLIVEPIVFENFANVGANVTILPGVTLAEGCVIGACSFVPRGTKTEPWTIYAGNPIKPIKKRPKEKMLRYAKELGYL